jgi:hypothetical protein
VKRREKRREKSGSEITFGTVWPEASSMVSGGHLRNPLCERERASERVSVKWRRREGGGDRRVIARDRTRARQADSWVAARRWDSKGSPQIPRTELRIKQV